jgi:hypothetical protein
MAEIRAIFEVSGGYERMKNIETLSKKQALEMGFDVDDNGASEEYQQHVYTANNNKHSRE